VAPLLHVSPPAATASFSAPLAGSLSVQGTRDAVEDTCTGHRWPHRLAWRLSHVRAPQPEGLSRPADEVLMLW